MRSNGGRKYLRAAGSGLPRCLFRQNALQRAPVHAEPSRRLRNIAIAKLVNPLNMLPAHPVRRHRIFRELGLIMRLGHESVKNLLGGGRLGQVIEGAEFHGGHRGCNITIARQNNAPCIRPPGL